MASTEVDMEMGTSSQHTPAPSGPLRSWLFPRLSSWTAFGTSYETAACPIEDYPAGYPRFSALVASHPSYHIARRFTILRAQLLLIKQDRLSMLEERLARFDSNKNNYAFLGCSREMSEPRRQILKDIDNAMAEYDRHQKAMSLDMAPKQARADLKNWVNGVGCIARKEIAYLHHTEDLICLNTTGDVATSWVELMVEQGRRLYHKHRAQSATTEYPPSFPPISRDPRVHVFPISSTRKVARMLMSLFITILLLSPVIVCNAVQSLSARLFIIVIAASTFVSLLAGLTKANTVELVVAGAT
ncbi:hypothetical protein FVEN_g5676 [Fusarium venenatum]|nr:hypothetical protein FVEN_g5676 [Fusarium venenatum]